MSSFKFFQFGPIFTHLGVIHSRDGATNRRGIYRDTIVIYGKFHGCLNNGLRRPSNQHGTLRHNICCQGLNNIVSKAISRKSRGSIKLTQGATKKSKQQVVRKYWAGSAVWFVGGAL